MPLIALTAVGSITTAIIGIPAAVVTATTTGDIVLVAIITGCFTLANTALNAWTVFLAKKATNIAEDTNVRVQGAKQAAREAHEHFVEAGVLHDRREKNRDE